jgi:cell division protease FtsH
MTQPDRPDRRGGDERPAKRPRNLFTLVMILGLAGILIVLYSESDSSGQEIQWSEFIKQVQEKSVKTITIFQDEGRVEGELKSGGPADKSRFTTIAPSRETFHGTDPDWQLIIDRRNEGELKVEIKTPSRFWSIILPILPWILIIGLFWFFFLRQMRGPAGTGGVLSFGRSRAKLHGKEVTNVTFDDVAGIEEAKEEVGEIIEFLKNPTKFQRLGGRIPRGVLLMGPPGTGKTLLAKAIAGEADVPFFSICGSDFVEMFVGVGASRVRDLFKQAKESSPCIIFLDEIDAVGRRRGAGLGGGHDEREQTLNAILVEMDGFETDTGIILCAATNRPDVLDPALLRPGRFDREITIDLPDLNGREAILKVHARKVRMADDIDLRTIARGTPMFSGADLEATINEAALIAVMKDRDAVVMDDLEEARDKVLWGRQKRSRVMAEEDRKTTAFHEAGHALIATLLEDAEPLHKVTIIPRGRALGATMQLPEQDRYTMQRRRLIANLTVLYGGRIAEELFCGDVSSGAQNDIKRATELGRRMVCEWGMSDAIGPINYSDSEETLFLGREVTKTQTHSEETSLLIDNEIKRILMDGYKRAEILLKDHRVEMERLAEALLKYEVLSRAEVDAVLEGGDVEELRKGKREAAEAAAEESPPDEAEEPITDEEATDEDLESEGRFAY